MIYLDNASTTKLNEDVIKVYNLISDECWANPSNKYKISETSKTIIEDCKKMIARHVGADPDEIFFTSGASEGNSWICAQRDRVYCSEFEHHNYTDNPKVSCVKEGDFRPEMVKQVYQHMLVSNITGEVFDVLPMFYNAKKHYGMFCGCDCTQALGNIKINLHELGCDMAVFSSHKVGGLKGTGFVYISKEVQGEIKPLIYGTQQDGLRGGTMNVAEYYATAEAVKRACRKIEEKREKGEELTRRCVELLDESGVEWLPISGSNSVPTTFAFCLKDVESEIIQKMLNEKEIYVATGSGCNDGSMKREPSLVALEIPDEYIGGFFRLSFSLENTVGEIEIVMKELIDCYKKLIGG